MPQSQVPRTQAEAFLLSWLRRPKSAFTQKRRCSKIFAKKALSSIPYRFRPVVKPQVRVTNRRPSVRRWGDFTNMTNEARKSFEMRVPNNSCCQPESTVPLKRPSADAYTSSISARIGLAVFSSQNRRSSKIFAKKDLSSIPYRFRPVVKPQARVTNRRPSVRRCGYVANMTSEARKSFEVRVPNNSCCQPESTVPLKRPSADAYTILQEVLAESSILVLSFGFLERRLARLSASGHKLVARMRSVILRESLPTPSRFGTSANEVGKT
jgi:hypothetical protein